MDIRKLLVLREEHKLTMKEISLILEVPENVIRQNLRGRIKPSKPKRSWLKAQKRRSKY